MSRSPQLPLAPRQSRGRIRRSRHSLRSLRPIESKRSTDPARRASGVNGLRCVQFPTCCYAGSEAGRFGSDSIPVVPSTTSPEYRRSSWIEPSSYVRLGPVREGHPLGTDCGLSLTRTILTQITARTACRANESHSVPAGRRNRDTDACLRLAQRIPRNPR